MRELSARAAARPAIADARDRGGDRDCPRGAAAGAAADIAGRLRLPGLRPPGRPARPRSVHARGRRCADRSGVPVRGLVLRALAIRPALHARELRGRAARPGGRAMGDESIGGRGEPRRHRAGRGCGRPPRALPAMGRGIRRSESRAAGAGRWRRAQRHAGDDAPRGSAALDGEHQPAPARGVWGDGGRRGHQGDRRSRAPVHRPCRERHPRTGEAGRLGGPLPRRHRGDRADRFRRSRSGVHQRDLRAAGNGRDPQHPGGDGPAGRHQRHAALVATRIRGGLPRGAGSCPVANRARGRLAGHSRLGDARAAGLDSVAAALVCDLGRCR